MFSKCSLEAIKIIYFIIFEFDFQERNILLEKEINLSKSTAASNKVSSYFFNSNLNKNLLIQFSNCSKILVSPDNAVIVTFFWKKSENVGIIGI